MLWTYLKRGVAAGGIAGIVYGLFMLAVGNPFTEYLEELAHHDHGHGHGHGHEHAVSETTTAVVSVGSGVLWGIFLGAVFALAYYFLEPSIPGTETVKPYVLAGAGFLTVSLTPWLVLPPLAPGMEQTVGMNGRMLIYGGLMVGGALLAALAVGLYRRLATRDRRLAVAAGFVPIIVALVVIPLATPTVVRTGDVAPELATAYQGVVAFGQAGLWLLLAGSYNWLSRREESQSLTQAEPTTVTDA